MTTFAGLLKDILAPRVTRGREDVVSHDTALDMLAAVLTLEPMVAPDTVDAPADPQAQAYRDGQLAFQEDVLAALHAVIGGARYTRPAPAARAAMLPGSRALIVLDGNGAVVAQHPRGWLDSVLRWCRLSLTMDKTVRPLTILDLGRAQTYTITRPDTLVARIWQEVAVGETDYPARADRPVS